MKFRSNKMEEEPVSGGYTVMLQVLNIVPALLMGGYILYLFFHLSPGFYGLIFLSAILIALTIHVARQLMFADIYKNSNQIIIKKINGIKKRSLSEIAEVNEGIFQYNFYLKFVDGRKIYFRLKPMELFKRANSFSSEDILKDIKRKLEPSKVD